MPAGRSSRAGRTVVPRSRSSALLDDLLLRHPVELERPVGPSPISRTPTVSVATSSATELVLSVSSVTSELVRVTFVTWPTR